MFSLNRQLQKDLSCFLFNNVWNPYGFGEKLENMTQKKLHIAKEKTLTYTFFFFLISWFFGVWLIILHVWD